MAGFLGFDPFGSIVCVGITTTFGGSILSIVLSLPFFRGRYRRAAIIAVWCHIFNMIAWVCPDP
jgi:hypothetical protein